jgi:hypothetical protein
VKASGEVAVVFERPAESLTVVVLRGAPEVEIRISGSHAAGTAPGDFVTVQGTKAGNTVFAVAVTHAVHPWGAAAPYVALGAALSGILACDLLVPLAMGRGFTPRTLLGGLRGRLRINRAHPAEPNELPGGAADNHSGALPPKN